MKTTLNYLAKQGIEFLVLPDTKFSPRPSPEDGSPLVCYIFQKWRKGYRIKTVSHEYTSVDVKNAMWDFMSDVNIALAAEKFEDWEHDFDTPKEAKAAYRAARLKAKGVLSVFGEDGWKGFCHAVEEDIVDAVAGA